MNFLSHSPGMGSQVVGLRLALSAYPVQTYPHLACRKSHPTANSLILVNQAFPLLLLPRQICSAPASRRLSQAVTEGSALLCCTPLSTIKQAACRPSVHTASDNSSEASTQQVALLLRLLSSARSLSNPHSAVRRPSTSQQLLLHTQQHSEPLQQAKPGHGTPQNGKEPKRKAKTSAAVELIPKTVDQRARHLGKLMTQQQKKPARDKLQAKYSPQLKKRLQERFRAVLLEAASMPLWESNPSGFLACLQEVEVLFQQLFDPLPSEQPPEHCCSVEATSANVSQCIDRILPLLLQPRQAPAHDILGVAEFLRDVMCMDGPQVFNCFAEEPAVLYLDVYESLLPLHDFFQNLQWQPEDYNPIISRHPQTLLLPLQQYQRNFGYLLGQGLSQGQVLSMWGQRAGLLTEPISRLHGEVLALRCSDRPLQDLALPFLQRAAPIEYTEGRRFLTGPADESPLAPARTGRMEMAVASLVGTAQDMYLHSHYRMSARRYKGVTQGIDGLFIATAPVGRNGSYVKLGRFSSMLTAARAYDAAMLKVYGRRRVVNFPEEHTDAPQK